MGYNFIPAGPAQLLQNTHNARSPSSYNSRPTVIHLFDPDHPQRPHPDLGPHLIQLFFEQLGPEFPFLNYQEVLAEFWEGTLPPALACAVAALAARYSNLPELAVRGLHNVSESYLECAKEAMSMAINLGLSDQHTIQMNPSELERTRRRSTWASIVQLHLMATDARA
ncbi:hypothetical protein ONZ45_g19591 [Pleurotus djamor]|nr:hypothetical protein ONZ45_g19591 [Pleurotus djamor]